MYFAVEDDGMGMTEERLEAVRRGLSKETDSGDGDGFGDGAGAGVPDEEPIEVPEGRLTVRDIMLRLEWEKREALGPGTGDTR